MITETNAHCKQKFEFPIKTSFLTGIFPPGHIITLLQLLVLLIDRLQRPFVSIQVVRMKNFDQIAVTLFERKLIGHAAKKDRDIRITLQCASGLRLLLLPLGLELELFPLYLTAILIKLDIGVFQNIELLIEQHCLLL